MVLPQIKLYKHENTKAYCMRSKDVTNLGKQEILQIADDIDVT